MKNSDILERANDWNQRGDYLRLRPAEWLLLASIDGAISVGDLVRRSKVDESFALASLLKFGQLDLVRRAELTWEEFCRRFPDLPSPGAEGTVFPPASPAPVPQIALPPGPVPPAPEPPTAGQTVRFRLSSVLRPAAAAPEIAIPTTPLPKPPASTGVAAAPVPPSPQPAVLATASVPLRTQPAPPPSSLSLRSVLDFVMGHAGGGNRGQLAVYRTFLKVPASQLRESGIKSLDLATSEVQITDPALQKSILNAVHAVIGEPYHPASPAGA